MQFERYADDIVCHCASEQEAQQLKITLEQRFTACGLTLRPTKTKIAYCKSGSNRGSYPQVGFDFLGHTFKPRLCKNRQGKYFVAFTPAISRKLAKKVRYKIAS